jgi:peroxiredoxin
MTRDSATGRFALLVVAAAAFVAAAGCSSVPAWMHEGNPAPALSGSTIDGRPVDLAAERGKVAAVVFFIDSCPMCRALYETERELADRMTGRPFVMIGVNGGDSPEVLRAATHREKITWPVVHDRDGTLAAAWGVTGVPVVYVVDGDGVIRGSDVSQEALVSTVESLLTDTTTR